MKDSRQLNRVQNIRRLLGREEAHDVIRHKALDVTSRLKLKAVAGWQGVESEGGLQAGQERLRASRVRRRYHQANHHFVAGMPSFFLHLLHPGLISTAQWLGLFFFIYFIRRFPKRLQDLTGIS